MELQATNSFTWILRDETETESSGLILPTSGQVKPHSGTVISVGELTADKKIKKGKKCLWHQSIGMEIEYDGTTYVVIESERILAVI